MTILNTIFIAFALAMDAFAVAIASGASLKEISSRQRFRLAWHFGFFQAMMPVVGWSAGHSIYTHIQQYDHWVAFGLLSFIGFKMIKDSFKDDLNENTKNNDPTRGILMVMLSVATSIDALAVGISISALGVSIWTPAIIIGCVAGFMTVIGMELGKWIGNIGKLCFYSTLFGGIILLGIGFDILIAHGVFD